jgi:hypothetical protein
MDKLSTWKEQIARLDAALHPIANRLIGFFGLLFSPRRRTCPLDEAGVRAQAEQFPPETWPCVFRKSKWKMYLKIWRKEWLISVGSAVELQFR